MSDSTSATEHYSRHNCAIGLHNPKCAGMTLLGRVRECLPGFEVYQNTGFVRNLFEERCDFIYLRDKKRLRFIFGHSIHAQMLRYLNPDSLLFTGVRNPIDRVASQYNYEVNLAKRLGQEQPDFKQFVDEHRDMLCWGLINRFDALYNSEDQNVGPAKKAYEILQSFDLIYDENSFEDCAKCIFAYLGINPSLTNENIGSYNEPKEVLDREYIEQQNECDVRLYRFLSEGGDLDIKNFDSRRNSALARRTEWVQQPPDEILLRDFIFKEMVKEYKYWNLISGTIELRIKQIELIHAEIRAMQAIQ